MSAPADARLADDLGRVIAVARRGARIVRAAYRSAALDVAWKGPGDPVTSADRAANAAITAELAATFPGSGIIAEETAVEPGGDDDSVLRALSRERVFYVDPLDGTREFLAQNGEFAVMIGMARGARAELGVVVLPATMVAFAGALGVGAFRENARGVRRPLAPSPCALGREARFIASRSHPAPLVSELMQAVGATAPVVPCGSVGVKVARLCAGEADAYVHDAAGVKKWDSCAPEALLRAAGGAFSDLAGRLIDYAEPRLALGHGICATNGALHAELVAHCLALRPPR